MSHTNPAPRRTWPWVVVVVVVVAAIIVGASLISSMIAGRPAAESTATSDAVTQSPIAPPVTTPSLRPTSTAKQHDRLTAADIAAIEGAIDDTDPTELYEYLHDPVHVEFAASDFNSDRTPDNAVTDLAYVDDTSGWNWNLDAATLASFRAGAYGDNFAAGSIVGESAEGYVISFSVTRASVTGIFVSKTVDLVTAPKG
ncbi:hypothetical protein BH11ACT2_BH11ACT2_09340 [soil metagenome]